MSLLEAPLSKAHHHAANADDALAKGLLIPAAEEYKKAADAFKSCIDHASDEGTKRTMRMLHDQHLKSNKELERRIAKLLDEHKDPSLPQLSSPSRAPSSRYSSPGVTNVALGMAMPSAPSPPPRGRMTDSQYTVDESFMVLGQRSDPGDAFNQFWKTMEGMLDNLSQPVAFATAPLGMGSSGSTPTKSALRSDGNNSSDTDIDDLYDARYGRRIIFGNQSRRSIDRSNVSGGSYVAPKDDPDQMDDFDMDLFAEDGDALSESFCLVPGSDGPTPAQLKKENAELKVEIETMKKRLAQTDRLLQLRKEQDQQLKDSIVLARHQAQKAMGASMVAGPRGGPNQVAIDFAGLSLNVPPVPPPVGGLSLGRDRESQLMRRVRELEEEVRVVKGENEKQKAMISKFRERWEKLKDSAKRKKEAKAAAASASAPVRERIDEVPEPPEDEA